MAEYRFFDPVYGEPDFTSPEFYADRERAPHLEQGAHRGRLMAAGDFIRNLVNSGCDIKGIVDLGCGDGGLLSYLKSQRVLVRAWGYDLQQSNVEPAVRERGVSVEYKNVLTDDITWGDLAIATEMLEHLADPHGFVRKIAEHSSFLVASSPVNETPESHYAFHLWSWDAEGYNALLEQAGFVVVDRWEGDGFQVIVGAKAP